MPRASRGRRLGGKNVLHDVRKIHCHHPLVRRWVHVCWYGREIGQPAAHLLSLRRRRCCRFPPVVRRLPPRNRPGPWVGDNDDVSGHWEVIRSHIHHVHLVHDLETAAFHNDPFGPHEIVEEAPGPLFNEGDRYRPVPLPCVWEVRSTFAFSFAKQPREAFVL